ncbi:unnamed protein product [Arabidopsis thaliana]|uniref:(thale cress) hypothetical protein n=1 Tax=Arabidopsis thaliana TaxID=3702 RepID=A0A7G2FCQ4_ARATH|nr:unnamed protein product [Arabidopsis thaliana]
MGMKKVKLSLIANERSRKTSFMKRKDGIFKKLHELSTLCGVQACALIYSPFIPVPESWPSREDTPNAINPHVLTGDMTPFLDADATAIQREFYNINLNLNLNLNSNQYLNQQQSFMNPMVEQHMNHVGGRESIPFVDGNCYNYHQLPANQLPAVDHASTSYMPSTTGVYDPYINNNL